MEVYVIMADPEVSSCIVNAVYVSRYKAELWIEKQVYSDKYYIEVSQLIK